MQEDTHESSEQNYQPNNQSKSGEHLSKRERRMLRKQQEQGKREQQQKKKKKNKLGIKLLLFGIAGGFIVFMVWLFSNQLHMPPVSMEGHIESSPSAHIVTSPIPENIQRHMLEHADGDRAPGIIIQYNCEDYSCAPDLIDKLTALVKEYPENVYLAPNNYDGMIILTKRGGIKVLDDFDEGAIRNFINR